MSSKTWPAAWKRPFYGPDVIAGRFIKAGHRLLEEGELMSNKTAEEARDEAFEEFLRERYGNPERFQAQTRSRMIDAFTAGVAHGAAVERQKTEAIIAVIRDEYGGHAVDNFVNDLHKRLKQERRQRGEK